MSRINTDNWKEYRIGELFEIENGRGITKQEIYEHPGELEAIQSGEERFGSIGLIDREYCISRDYVISEVPCLTVARSGSSGFVGYHISPCVVGDSAKLLIPKFQTTEYVLLYLRAVLMVNKKKYAYNDKVTEDRYKADKILLPVTKSGDLDVEYMEKYIQRIEERISDSLLVMLSISKLSRKMPEVSGWKEFHLYDVFEIDSGNKFDKAKMDTSVERINFVGRSNYNNGITQKVNVISGVEPYAPGNLTLALGGAYLGSCFAQEEPFYTSQNVVVLKPKDDISFEAKQFIATTIFRESQNNYRAFIKELNAHIKRDFSIMLPSAFTGKPDYEYMTKYIKGIREKCQHRISVFD